jgi:outer membrane protein insertion porin family
LLLTFLLAAFAARTAAQGFREPPPQILSEVRIQGNVEIETAAIRGKLLSRAGSPFEQNKVNTDIKSLYKSGWFSNVAFRCYEEPPGSGKLILVFTVRENPVIKQIEYRGRKRSSLGMYVIGQKELDESTGLKVGSRADAMKAIQARATIQRLYIEKGYDLAEVRLLEGGKVGDTRVIFEIFEGPKHTVGPIAFEGNTFVSDGVLRTKIKSKRPILGIGGVFHQDVLEKDKEDLTQYYQDQGFYEAKVMPVTRPGKNLGDVQIVFVISEGVRYKVRKVVFQGNRQLTEAALRENLMMKTGEPILKSVRDADEKTLLGKYYALGCFKTHVMGKYSFTEEPGMMDWVYEIEESDPYLVGEIKIVGNVHTQDRVLRREATMAGLVPGEVLDKARVELFQKRLMNLRYFGVMNGPGAGAPPGSPGNEPVKIRIVNERPGNRPYGDMLPLMSLEDDTRARMQSPAPEPDAGPGAPPPPAGGLPGPFTGDAGPLAPPRDTLVPVPDAPPDLPPLPPAVGPGTPPVGAGEPRGIIPSVPGMNATDIGPDRGDAFPNRSYADVLASVEEAPTGNLMLSFGASQWQGLYGQVNIVERNFNPLNFPRSLSDITNGAFRGGGMQFSVNAMVGTVFNQFSVSLIEPYVFDLPITLGGTGYYRTRIYPQWVEDRGGGRVWLGRMFGPRVYADIAVRGESVDFFGYRTPAPADYLAATGYSTLFSLRPSLRWDNRNSPYLPTSGQYVNVAFEYGWGTFHFPKVDLEGRTYFTLGSRPDGSGPRTLELRGFFGVTGADTPVYERYFAGNFGSLRGFQYRGVGPHVLGANTGGLMSLLGSVEYMIPLTASDNVRQVFFCDFGTVEPNYQITNFRASVGTGLRLFLPMFGPLPLAFDLGFPVALVNGDKVNYFTFSIGMTY